MNVDKKIHLPHNASLTAIDFQFFIKDVLGGTMVGLTIKNFFEDCKCV